MGSVLRARQPRSGSGTSSDSLGWHGGDKSRAKLLGGLNTVQFTGYMALLGAREVRAGCWWLGGLFPPLMGRRWLELALCCPGTVWMHVLLQGLHCQNNHDFISVYAIVYQLWI